MRFLSLASAFVLPLCAIACSSHSSQPTTPQSDPTATPSATTTPAPTPNPTPAATTTPSQPPSTPAQLHLETLDPVVREAMHVIPLKPLSDGKSRVAFVPKIFVPWDAFCNFKFEIDTPNPNGNRTVYVRVSSPTSPAHFASCTSHIPKPGEMAYKKSLEHSLSNGYVAVYSAKLIEGKATSPAAVGRLATNCSIVPLGSFLTSATFDTLCEIPKDRLADFGKQMAKGMNTALPLELSLTLLDALDPALSQVHSTLETHTVRQKGETLPDGTALLDMEFVP